MALSAPKQGKPNGGWTDQGNIQVLTTVLAGFARAVGASATQRIILVLDGAAWHTTRALARPEGLHLVFLPPYSPELQPAERLWPMSNEALVNRHFADIAALEATHIAWCDQLQQETEAVRGRTLFSWWPRVTA